MNIFISYSREDINWAQKLFDWLKSTTVYNPWIDTENLLPGSDWEWEILSTIKSAKAILLLISKNSVDKVGYIQKEIKEVLARFDYFPPNEIFIIPVRLDDTVPKYSALEKLQWVDLYLNWNKGIERIALALEKINPKDTFKTVVPQIVYKIHNSVSLELIEQLYQKNEVEIHDIEEISKDWGFKILRDEKSKASVLAYRENTTLYRIEKIRYSNVKPLNAEQTFYFWALTQNKINLVCLSGVPGTGKSFLTANYLFQLAHKKKIFILGNNERHKKIYNYFLEYVNVNPRKNDVALKNIVLLEIYTELLIQNLSNSIVVCYFDDTEQYVIIKELLLQMQDDTKFVIISRRESYVMPKWLNTLYSKLKDKSFFAFIALNKIQRSSISMELNEIL